MYNIETLKEYNQTYDFKHRLTQKDVDMANSHISVIESTRTDDRPQPGDLLRYTDEHGDYHHNGRIEQVDFMPGTMHGCEDVTPWIFRASFDSKMYSVSLNGGPWFRVPRKGPRLIDKEMAGFKDWGHCGACAGGAVSFRALVNVWEYTKPDAKFPPEYTTKYWRKQYIYFLTEAQAAESSQFNYRIKGDGIAFRTQIDYHAWLTTFKGNEFDGYYPNQKVVFLYREKEYYIKREEWDALDLPLDTRMCNGIILVKVRYDDENHILHTFRFTNNGSAIERLNYGPYELTKGKDLSVLLKQI